MTGVPPRTGVGPTSVVQLLLLVNMALCGRVWTWNATVPEWGWVALALSGWACFRVTLRAKDSASVAPSGRHGDAFRTLASGRWSALAWSVTCGVCAYAANLSHPPDVGTVVGCCMLGILLRARLGLGVAAMTATSVSLVALVLLRAGADSAAHELATMGGAWACGMGVAGAALALLWGSAPAPAFLLGVESVASPRVESPSENDAWTLWHGRSLVLTAACVPLGEGLAIAMLVLLGLIVVVRRRTIPWALLRKHRALPMMGAALACWLVAGVWAILIGGEGWLKPSELGRWAPYLALGLPALSVGAVPARYFKAAGVAFVASLLLACIVGLVMHGLDLRPGSGALAFLPVPSPQAWVPHTSRTVAGGFFFHRLKMAHVLLVGIACLSVRQVSLQLPARRRLGEMAALGLMGVTLFYTFARGAWVGLAAVIGVCVLLASWRWRLALLVTALGTVIGVMSLPQQRDRLYSMADPAASAVRATVWHQAVIVMQEHPWGVGLGNYTPLIGRYYDRIDPRHEFPQTYPHNMVLAAWAESGPVGLASYLAVWVIFFAVCAAAVGRGRSDDPEHAAIGAVGLAAGVALWVVGLTHDVLFHNAVALAFCGMAGLVLALLIAPPEHVHVGKPCP